MLNHTPGPWMRGARMEDRDGDPIREIHSDAGGEYKGAYVGSVAVWSAENEGNAQLIAKAPQMYHLLSALVGASMSTVGDYKCHREARELLKELEPHEDPAPA